MSKKNFGFDDIIKQVKQEKQKEKLAPCQIYHLCTGFYFDFMEGPEPPFATDKERRQAWADHKDYILSLKGKKIGKDDSWYFGSPDSLYYDDMPSAYYDYE